MDQLGFIFLQFNVNGGNDIGKRKLCLEIQKWVDVNKSNKVVKKRTVLQCDSSMIGYHFSLFCDGVDFAIFIKKSFIIKLFQCKGI